MKSYNFINFVRLRIVASHRGAWIEIVALPVYICTDSVASHRGAWIEIDEMNIYCQIIEQSRPTGARGLKSCGFVLIRAMLMVASHRGAWIEIVKILYLN